MGLPFLQTAWIAFQEQLPLLGEESREVLRVGDHVAKRENPTETIGIIDQFEDDLVFIVAPQWMRDRHFPFSRYDREHYEDVANLIRTDGYSIEQLTYAIYGRMHHSYYDVPRSEFDGWRKKKIPCEHEKCKNMAVGVGLFNVWGTVFPAAMCVEHTHMNGCCGDFNPFTNNMAKTTS